MPWPNCRTSTRRCWSRWARPRSCTLDDLADLATDELIAKKRVEQRRRDRQRRQSRRDSRPEDKGGVLGEYGLNEEQGNEIIMAARAHWFDEEPELEEAADAGSSQ